MGVLAKCSAAVPSPSPVVLSWICAMWFILQVCFLLLLLLGFCLVLFWGRVSLCRCKLALNSQGPTCPCLKRARTKGVCHHTWQEGAMIKIWLTAIFLSCWGSAGALSLQVKFSHWASLPASTPSRISKGLTLGLKCVTWCLASQKDT